jgi:hypothetical protein
MALPLLLALMAASTAANYAGKRKSQHAMNRVMDRDSARRDKLQHESQVAAMNTSDLFTGAAGKQKANADAREAAAAAASAPVNGAPAALPPGALSTYVPTDSTVTIAENERQARLTRDKLGTIGRARASLEDFGNIMAGNAQAIARNAQDQAQAVKAGEQWEQYVLPQQMQAAQGAGRDWSTLGDILQLAATIYAPHGLAKAPGGSLKSGFDVSTTSGAGGANPSFWRGLV